MPAPSSLLCGLGRGTDEHARGGDRDRWQDVTALVSDEGLERGDPHGLCLRGAAIRKCSRGDTVVIPAQGAVARMCDFSKAVIACWYSPRK